MPQYSSAGGFTGSIKTPSAPKTSIFGGMGSMFGSGYTGSSGGFSSGGQSSQQGNQQGAQQGVQAAQKPQGQQGGVNAAAAMAAAAAVARAAQQAQQQRQTQQGQGSKGSPLQRNVVSSQGFGNLPETSMRPGPGFNGGMGMQPYGQGHLSAGGANRLSLGTQVGPTLSRWAGISGGSGLQPYGQGTRTAERANQISMATQVPGRLSLPGRIDNPNMHHETAMNGGFGIPGYGAGNTASLPARTTPQTQVAGTPRFTGIGGGAGVQAYGQSVRPAAAATRTAQLTQVPQFASPMAGQGQPGFNQHSKTNGLDPMELRSEYDKFALADRVTAPPTRTATATPPTNFFAMRKALGELGGPMMPPQTLITAAQSAGGQVASGPETQPDPPNSWWESAKKRAGNGLEAAKAAGQQIYDAPGTVEQKAAAIKGNAQGGLLGAALGYLTGGSPLGFAPSNAFQAYPGSTNAGGSGLVRNPQAGAPQKKKKKKPDDATGGGGSNAGGPVYPGYYSTWAGLPKGPVLG